MPKQKTGKWSPAETATVLGIPKDRKTHSVLLKISNKLNRPYNSVYQKWLFELKKNATAPVNVPAMTFKVVDVVGKSRVSPEEEAAMIKGIEASRNVLSPETKRGILLPSHLVNRAKTYLREKNPSHVYSFSKSNTKGFLILSRRV